MPPECWPVNEHWQRRRHCRAGRFNDFRSSHPVTKVRSFDAPIHPTRKSTRGRIAWQRHTESLKQREVRLIKHAAAVGQHEAHPGRSCRSREHAEDRSAWLDPPFDSIRGHEGDQDRQHRVASASTSTIGEMMPRCAARVGNVLVVADSNRPAAASIVRQIA
jgi:hypothetical protein